MCLSVVLKTRIDTERSFTNLIEYTPSNKNSKIFYDKLSRPTSSKIIGYKAVITYNNNSYYLSIPSNYRYGEELEATVVPVQNENQIYMSGFHVIPRLKDLIEYINSGFIGSFVDIYMVELSDITSIGFEKTYNGVIGCILTRHSTGFTEIPCYVGNKMKILRKCISYDINTGKVKHEKL